MSEAAALLLDSISAAVIGGVSLFEGRGEVRGALLGSLIIATIANGLNIGGYSTGTIYVVTGTSCSRPSRSTPSPAGRGALGPLSLPARAPRPGRPRRSSKVLRCAIREPDREALDDRRISESEVDTRSSDER